VVNVSPETATKQYIAVRDNYNLKSHKYVCITTYHPDTKHNPIPNPNPTTKEYQIKSNQFICQHNTEKQDLI